jgi:hypothetical protein
MLRSVSSYGISTHAPPRMVPGWLRGLPDPSRPDAARIHDHWLGSYPCGGTRRLTTAGNGAEDRNMDARSPDIQLPPAKPGHRPMVIAS